MKYIESNLLGSMTQNFKQRIYEWYIRKIRFGFSKKEAKIFTYDFFKSKYGYSKQTLNLLTKDLEKNGFIERLNETTIKFIYD